MSNKPTITTHIGGAGTQWPTGPQSPDKKKREQERKRGK